MNNAIIEINKKKAKAGRTPIKMILHEIHDSPENFNANGISWSREYTELNMDSVKTMPLATQFLDSDYTIPFGAHGELTSKDGKVVFEDSVVVGAFEDSYIDDNIEVNGKKISALIGKAYIFDQRFPELVEYLQEQYDEGNSVETSVEICADKSKGNTKIIYDGGWKETGRVPQNYQYSGQALCIGVEPSDKSALMIELNSCRKNNKKEGENELAKSNKTIKSPQTIEINEMTYDDIALLITRAFNKAMLEPNEDGCCHYCDYYIHRFYPVSGRIIMREYNSMNEFYMTTYTLQNSTITLGEIVKVQEDWTPAVEDEVEVEINSDFIKDIILKSNKEVDKTMDKEMLAEINKNLADKTAEVVELNAKITELNEIITNANKIQTETADKLKETEEKLTGFETELNSYKEKENKEKEDAIKAEVNTYFTVEIAKNGFEESEVNSLKSFVDACDLDGLKKAESDLCAKKFKEMINKTAEEAETNSKKDEEAETNTLIMFSSPKAKTTGTDEIKFFTE